MEQQCPSNKINIQVALLIISADEKALITKEYTYANISESIKF